ncbi:helix-turn-helix domain-containing protein [Streptosporangium carneum]|uniref:Transcriptional regulator n=1 Tax=Streptosporangium carneum TaxID=47481 RepID=A0A9W6MES0_9ACTN|nr:helix-turn-helix transcriptional regulator [Streptosporangium carneum]GLK11889.1 transcriptional regulator [Streptosporangium carneum]
MPNPAKLDPGKSPIAYFGYELRKHRIGADLSQRQLAARVNYSIAMISSVERGQQSPTMGFAQKCDEALKLDGALARIKEMIDNATAKLPTWFRAWIEAEQNAEVLRTWEPIIVPGLLQTEDYARAAIKGKPGISVERLERSVASRMERQRILRRDDAPSLWAVLDESVLSRPIGDDAVVAEQLDHLLECADAPNIVIQVLPIEARSTTGLLGGFMIAQGPGVPDTVYLESAIRGQVSHEPADIKAASMWYEVIRAEALPQSSSLKMIEEKRDQWKRTT